MKKSKYSNLNKGPNPSDVGRRNAELERSREKLMESIMEFKELLSDTVILANKTQPEKQKLSNLLDNINNLVLDVDSKNIGEGARTVGTIALNSILFLKDEINQLKWANFYLTKRVEELEAKEPPVEEEEESVDEEK